MLDAYPLAWVCADGADGMEASLLPLVGRYDEQGKLVELIGHLMRLNPLHSALERRPRASILFKGPDAYISPEHARLRDWAPTWNYAQLRIEAEIMFDDAFTGSALTMLIDEMERGRHEPWHAGELGPRYQTMMKKIVGFRARVVSRSGKFKLGQDEKPDVLKNILARLPDTATAAWMTRFNTERL
ncbi:transcriptional regulator [Sphingopyxis panaciterrae]|nr:transcriptional regulator [Sphingopyxis panaciterrae]